MALPRGSQSLYFFISFFGYNLECMLFLFNAFDKPKEKYANSDFVNFSSLEINYFVGTGRF